MKTRELLPVLVVLSAVSAAPGYVEAPHTLGRCVHESTNIVLVEVVRINKEKGLIIYKKLEDIKGKHPQDQIKHNIGQRGFHPREWQNVMKWAEEGKKAVFFHNGGASETCIGTYWYQCYPEADWWGMSHAEPFLLRSYCGDVDKLAAAAKAIHQGKEVIVPCMVDGNKELLHQRKAKLQRLKASLKLLEYDQKRDFAGWGGDTDDIPEFKSILLLAQSTAGWKFTPVARAGKIGDSWRLPDFDDKTWRSGKAPIGYGEDEINKRHGTHVSEQGQPFYFRRSFDVTGDLLSQKGVIFLLHAASDDSAEVYLNGKLADKDPEQDHEFAYWNRDVELTAKQLQPGRNVLAVLVKNKQGSSDLYLDVEVEAQIPVPKPARAARPLAAARPLPQAKPLPLKLPASGDPKPGQAPVVDKQKRTVTVSCVVAPRKLPNLDQIYPIEVGATYPAPEGQKAHETVVNFSGFRPSDVHKALEQLGLKPGKPAYGEDVKAAGPEVKLYLELVDKNGKPRRIPLGKLLVDAKTGRTLDNVTWHFTGSEIRQPDPERDDKVYGADLSGTLISLFPVTADTVIQAGLTMKDEAVLKLEADKKELSRLGMAVKLVIEVK